MRLIDAALIVWVLAWVGLGVAIGVEMHRLTDLSKTVSVDGQAIDAVGRSLTSLSDLPLVGNVADALAMGLGLLIDAFVVRTILVPALIALVGVKSAWPGRRLSDLAGRGRRAASHRGLPGAH